MSCQCFFVYDENELFFFAEAIGHPIHGHLLGLPVRAVRLLMVFHTRSCDRAQRHLQYILLAELDV